VPELGARSTALVEATAPKSSFYRM
jgi:hypothetical protein